jgi:hypothetical protein
MIRWIYVGAMLVSFPVGWTVSKLILVGLFYGMFTPLALLFRLLGRDVLGRRRAPAATTYWAPKPMSTEGSDYFRPY